MSSAAGTTILQDDGKITLDEEGRELLSDGTSDCDCCNGTGCGNCTLHYCYEFTYVAYVDYLGNPLPYTPPPQYVQIDCSDGTSTPVGYPDPVYVYSNYGYGPSGLWNETSYPSNYPIEVVAPLDGTGCPPTDISAYSLGNTTTEGSNVTLSNITNAACCPNITYADMPDSIIVDISGMNVTCTPCNPDLSDAQRAGTNYMNWTASPVTISKGAGPLMRQDSTPDGRGDYGYIQDPDPDNPTSLGYSELAWCVGNAPEGIQQPITEIRILWAKDFCRWLAEVDCGITLSGFGGSDPTDPTGTYDNFIVVSPPYTDGAGRLVGMNNCTFSPLTVSVAP